MRGGSKILMLMLAVIFLGFDVGSYVRSTG